MEVKFFAYKGTMQEVCLRLMGKKLLVALAMEGKFTSEGLQAIDGDDGRSTGTAVRGGRGHSASYQWARLLRIAGEVGRRVYVPLWRKDPVRVVREEIAAGLDIRLVHLAAEPLTAELLGRRLDLALVGELERRSREVRTVNVAGEGGEFETLVVDAPFFEQRIETQVVERTVTGSTAHLVIEKARLVPKDARWSSGGRP